MSHWKIIAQGHSPAAHGTCNALMTTSAPPPALGSSSSCALLRAARRTSFVRKRVHAEKKPGPAVKGETTSEQKRPLQENTRAVSSSWPVGHQGLEKTCKLKDSATIGSRKHGAGVSKQSRGKVPDVNWTHGEYLSSEGNQ